MKSDLPGILELVNTVFCRANQKPETMGSQFPLLFSEDNVKHLWVADDEGQIVSHVGAFVTEALVEGVPVTIASIGSVATATSYRGRGLSSRLLQMAWKQLREEQVDIVLVSGNRGLYFRNGCYQAGTMYFFIMKERAEPMGGYALKKANQMTSCVSQTFIDLEKGERTRFLRTPKEFRQLYEAAGYCRIFPWRQEAYFVQTQHQTVAYFILGFEEIKGNREKAHIIEFHGDRKAVAVGLLQLYNNYETLSEMIVPVLKQDPLCRCLETLGITKSNSLPYPGTMKLLNPRRFWLKFKDILCFNNADSVFRYDPSTGMYSLYEGHACRWQGMEEQFAQWVFSYITPPWPNGLNYI
jgi:predicted acetyltransferase